LERTQGGRPECVEYMNASKAFPDLKAYSRGLDQGDVRTAVVVIQAPTLLMQPRTFGYSTLAEMQVTAAQIANCEIAFCEGHTYPHTGAGSDERLRRITEFLGRSEVGLEPVAGFLIILFTDLENSTALT